MVTSLLYEARIKADYVPPVQDMKQAYLARGGGLLRAGCIFGFFYSKPQDTVINKLRQRTQDCPDGASSQVSARFRL